MASSWKRTVVPIGCTFLINSQVASPEIWSGVVFIWLQIKVIKWQEICYKSTLETSSLCILLIWRKHWNGLQLNLKTRKHYRLLQYFWGVIVMQWRTWNTHMKLTCHLTWKSQSWNFRTNWEKDGGHMCWNFKRIRIIGLNLKILFYLLKGKYGWLQIRFFGLSRISQ